MIHFRADSPLNRRLNQGHINRKGHPITGYYVETEPGIAKLIRICCGEHEEN